MTPDEHTIKEFYLDVGNDHELYVQDWGNPKAKMPIIFLHGGPGVGVKDRYRQPFDPNKQRVIFFDQRGSGKSLPYGELKHNTTNDLVDDIEKLADHLQLKKFVVTGGSWGSTLALAYGLAHPERVEALVLHGIFTGSKAEGEWISNGYFKSFFPDVWATYLKTVPKSHQSDPSAYHFKQAFSDNTDQAKASIFAYGNLEAGVMSLDDRFMPDSFETFDPASLKIEMQYIANNCFMPDRHILKNAHKLTMPVWIVQGRYDAVCSPSIAYELHNKLPDSNLIWTTSNHRPEHETIQVLKAILLQWS